MGEVKVAQPVTPQREPRPIRVLVAEDDEDHVLLLRRALRYYHRPVDLIVARDGQEAVERLHGSEARPDLILLDINMPMLSGLEVLRIVKSERALMPIPTVILTTSAREEDREASFERGADDFITKPVNFRRFYGSLIELLDRFFLGG